MKRALITGITGQDGSYLAELLLSKGYNVFGTVKHNSDLHRIGHILSQIILIEGDLTDQEVITGIIKKYEPNEVYNLAAPSFAQTSSEYPVVSAEIVALGVTRLLESIRLVKPDTKFYQAGSSELFGNPQEYPQDENTSFRPINLYSVSKLYAHWATAYYRENCGLFAVSGICFTHDSPRRHQRFVTRKITDGAVRIKLGLSDKLYLGNLDSRRDWGYAKDYVVAMWLMLQNDKPTDYVIGTGETHSVTEFCDLAFRCLDLDYREYVEIDHDLYRTNEENLRVANSNKIRKELGWTATLPFEDLVQIMIQSDLNKLKVGENGNLF